MTQRVRKRRKRMHQPAPLVGRTLGQADDLPGQRAAVVEQSSPELSRLPIAIVAGVVAKSEKHRERHAEQRERDGRQVKLVADQLAVCPSDEHRQRGGPKQLRHDPRQDGPAPDKEHAQPVWALTDDHKKAGTKPPTPPRRNHSMKSRLNCIFPTAISPAAR